MVGAAVSEDSRGRLSALVIATKEMQEEQPEFDAGSCTEPATECFDLHRESPLVDSRSQGLSCSRYAAPPPHLSSQEKAVLFARQKGSRSPNLERHSRWRQSLLPLDIVSKGRFQKSEPTIHRGEDLDVPTYIRRGIKLN